MPTLPPSSTAPVSYWIFPSFSIIAFMVMSIISAIFALPLLVFAGIGFGGGRRSNGFSIVCYGVQIIVGLLQGVVAITTSAFACRATCCGRKQNPGAVIYSQITNGEQTFATIPLNQIIQQSAQATVPTVAPASNFAAKEEGNIDNLIFPKHTRG